MDLALNTGVDVSWWVAFGAGFLSFFSPCILPMIPAYIMYITGTTSEEDVEKNKGYTFLRTMGFIFGFTLIFVIMGSTASYLGKIFIKNKMIFAKISGTIIFIFGLNMLGILKIGLLNSEKRLKAPKKVSSWFGSILMGMAFAAGWTPCFGPVLGAILFYAGGTATVAKGTMLLFIYSLGMAIPFIITALFINKITKFINKSDKFMQYIPKISGAIMIIFGLLIFFNKMVDISRFLL